MSIPAAELIALSGQKRHAEGGLDCEFVLERLDAINFRGLTDLLASTETPAVISVDKSRKPCTHAELREFICGLRFDSFGLGRNDRVAMLLPNGPELAVGFIAVLAYCTCAPLNAANTPAEVETELVNVNAKAILVMAGEDNDGYLDVAERLGLVVLEATPHATTAGLFSLSDRLTRGEGSEAGSRGDLLAEKRGPQQREDVALVLHTSGSTGNKKVVPHALEDLVAGALCIAAACELKPSDICANQMPLFHVGGIARNVLSPILSGGAVVAMPYFEPALFWSTVAQTQATWYYAGPTMHMLVLDAYKAMEPRPRISLRFIANAAGPLLPSVAQDMRDTYSEAAGGFCSIMPSYGMTECMPISSPPVGYNLDRPGTSGQIVGPACQIQDGDGTQLPFGEEHVGHIMVKGHPVMRAYENNPEETAKCFINGWFKTGDMGYIDSDNYLYVTGRSKEVINRGGEIIPPTEVEEALLSHPAVKNLVAFATPHDLLQETIGVCIVTEPGQPRVGLAGLQLHASHSLHPAKWPALVVYANDIPKTGTGKAMRVRLDKRMGLPSINDATPEAGRLFEAQMVPPGAAVQAPIPTAPLAINAAAVEAAVRAALAEADGALEVFVCARELERKPQWVAYLGGEDAARPVDVERLTAQLCATTHEYLVPAAIKPLPALPRAADGSVDEAALPAPASGSAYVAPSSGAQAEVQAVWMDVLGLEKAEEASVDDDFFHAGGTSLLAGTLAAALKKRLGLPLTGTALFRLRTIEALADALEAHRGAQRAEEALQPVGGRSFQSRASRATDRASEMPGMRSFLRAIGLARPADEAVGAAPAKIAPRGQAEPLVLVVQSLPLLLFHPVRRVGSWLAFVCVWLLLLRPPAGGGAGWNRFPAMLVALLGVAAARSVVFPLLGIALKWLIVGRYEAGRFRLWGAAYLRWWLVNQALRFCGKGAFDATNGLRITYYRLLGAQIGVGCTIGRRAALTEADLVTLGDGVALDCRSAVSPFCADGGAMLLSAITIGDGAAVCTKSIIAPGAALPAGACLPPLSSSHELADAAPEHRAFCRAAFPPPPASLQLLVGLPSIAFVHAARWAPLVALLFVMVAGRDGDPQTWESAITWFLSARRLGFYVLIVLARTLLCPFVELAAVILVKRLVIGRFVAGPKTSWSHFQYWLMHALLPNGRLCGCARLVGNHWGGVTFMLRQLGATCGERVFWPGSGLDVVEYDLLKIGDDCVFGSRSTFLCGDALENAPIELRAGANVADRCVVLPGVTLGTNGCLGSGSLAPKGATLGAGCVTVGSTGGACAVLDAGVPEADTASPDAAPFTHKAFGRAFYGAADPEAVAAGKPPATATWPVPPVWLYALYVGGWSAFAALLRASQIVFAWALADAITGKRRLGAADGTYSGGDGAWSGLAPYAAALFGAYVLVHLLVLVCALGIDVGVKWLWIGERQPGTYPWDESSYCMRWNLYLSAACIRKRLLGYLEGSAFLVWYFRAMGGDIGKDVCLYPSGSDPMMTEPELVSIGDGACINRAFVICHTNTKGQFSLNRVVIGERATLRSGSRLMAGATLEADARLLEHTLALVGDTVDAGQIWQGWPVRSMHNTAEYWRSRRQAIKMGRKQAARKARVLHGLGTQAAAHGELKTRMLAMEAQLRQVNDENERLRRELDAAHAAPAAPAAPVGTLLDRQLERQREATIAALSARVELLTREFKARERHQRAHAARASALSSMRSQSSFGSHCPSSFGSCTSTSSAARIVPCGRTTFHAGGARSRGSLPPFAGSSFASQCPSPARSDASGRFGAPLTIGGVTPPASWRHSFVSTADSHASASSDAASVLSAASVTLERPPPRQSPRGEQPRPLFSTFASRAAAAGGGTSSRGPPSRVAKLSEVSLHELAMIEEGHGSGSKSSSPEPSPPKKKSPKKMLARRGALVHGAL